MVLRRPGQSEPEVSGSGAMGAAQLYIAPERLSPAERQSSRLSTNRQHAWGRPRDGHGANALRRKTRRSRPHRPDACAHVSTRAPVKSSAVHCSINSVASARNRANGAGPQLRLPIESHAHRTQRHELSSDRVVHGDNQRQRRSVHTTRELRRKGRANGDREGVQHVAATHIEAPVDVEHDAPNHIAEGTADVDVGQRIGGDNPRPLAPPRADGDVSASGWIQCVASRARGSNNRSCEKSAAKYATNRRRWSHASSGHEGRRRP